MKFIERKITEHSSEIVYKEFPTDLQQWISHYDPELDPRFAIDLSAEISSDQFNYIECWINREARLAKLTTCPITHLTIEGSTVHVVRDRDNILTGDEMIRFKMYKDSYGWKQQKYALIAMNKAISVIKYVVENLSFPCDVRLDRWQEVHYQNS